MRTLKLSAAALALSVALASCGGGNPAPQPDDNTQPPAAETPGDTSPVTGGTIARPEGSTAANEFIIKGERARALAQSLGFSGSAQAVSARTGGLSAQATTDEMRVLLAVTRAKTGENAGKKRAVATFVWGNGEEKTVAIDKNTYAITLDIYPQNDPGTVKRYEGGLEMEVKYPDFQAKASRNGSYVSDTGAMCAKLAYNFKTAPMQETAGYTPLIFNNTAAPLEVCEGTTERNAEKVALEKAVTGLNFTAGSVAAAPFLWTSKDGVTALPTTAAELAAIAGTSESGTLTTQSLADFFAPLVVMPAGESTTWTAEQKAQAATARKYVNLQKQFGYYYRSAQVYTVTGAAGREDIVILGLNGWGVGGLKTIRFK